MNPTFLNTKTHKMALSPYVENGRYSCNDFAISVKHAIEMTEKLEVQVMPFHVLESSLSDDCWGFEDDNHRVSIIPFDVLETRKPRDHYDRIISADLSFPIIIYFDDDIYEWFIIDGMHRLAKAKMLGRSSINVKVLLFETLKNLK